MSRPYAIHAAAMANSSVVPAEVAQRRSGDCETCGAIGMCHLTAANATPAD